MVTPKSVGPPGSAGVAALVDEQAAQGFVIARSGHAASLRIVWDADAKKPPGGAAVGEVNPINYAERRSQAATPMMNRSRTVDDFLDVSERIGIRRTAEVRQNLALPRL